MFRKSRYVVVAGLVLFGWVFVGTEGRAAVNEGTLLWAKQWGGNDRDAAQSVAVLPDGSYLVLGFFENHFAPDLAPRMFGLRDIFVAKYSADGVVQWIKSAGSGHCDVGGAISALPDGTFAITGSYGYGGASATFGYGEPGQVTLSGWNHYSICLARFNADGTLQWVRRVGGNGWDSGDDVAVAPDGSCYMVGVFEMSATFGIENPPTQVVLVAGDGSPDSYDSFFARYRPDGSFAWVKQGFYQKVAALPDGSCVALLMDTIVRYSAEGDELWGDACDAYAWDIQVQPGTSEFLAGIARYFGPDTVRKYRAEDDGSLTLIWETEVGATALYAAGLAVRADGTAFVYDRGYGILYRFRADGALDWQAPVTVPAADIAASPMDDSCLAVGALYQTIVFGPGQTNQTTLEHWGSGDIFLAKYQPATYYRLNVSHTGEGYVALEPSRAYYPEGAAVAAKAGPWWPERSRFVRWEGDLAEYETPAVTITVPNTDLNATAVFELLPDATPLPAASIAGLATLATALGLAISYRVVRPGPSRSRSR